VACPPCSSWRCRGAGVGSPWLGQQVKLWCCVLVWNVILQVSIPVVDELTVFLKIGNLLWNHFYYQESLLSWNQSKTLFKFQIKRFHESSMMFNVLYCWCHLKGKLKSWEKVLRIIFLNINLLKNGQMILLKIWTDHIEIIFQQCELLILVYL
jgi:hypothetical protein